MSAFEKIKLGLEEAIAYEKGELMAKETTLSIAPVDTFQPYDIVRSEKKQG